MTPQPFIRRRGLVQALHVVQPGDEANPHDGTLDDAANWLRAHGVRCALQVAPTLGSLRIFGDRAHATLDVGQWLVMDSSFKSFDVLDDFDFWVMHDADDLEALMRAVQ